MTTLIPKFDFKDGSATPTGAVNRPINQKLLETVSITDFGGTSGSGDNTTAMNNATAYLNGLGGGIVFIPPGDWKMNWVCTYSNITVQGSGGKGELDTSCIRPYDITKPAITISDGTTITRYVALVNVHVSGSDGTTNGLTKAANNAPQALLLNGGTVNFTADRCVFYNGVQTVALVPSATNPVTQNRFINCNIRNDITDSSNIRGIYMTRLADPGYLTDNLFIATKLNGLSSGYAAECNGTTAGGIVLQIIDSYWDIHDGHGIWVRGNSNINCFNLTLDPGAIGKTVITSDQTNLDPARFIIGNLNAGGQVIAFSGGSTTLPTESTLFGYKPTFYNTYLTSDNYFAPINNPYSTAINLASDSGNTNLILSGANFAPGADNSKSIGIASNRWSVVYAATGTINTSDATQKQQVADLTSAEQATAKTIKGLIKSFKFNDAVAKKGDKARTHIGVMAQDVKAAFTANGLDADKYSLFCSDTWKDENGVEHTQLGVRYEELLAFVISAL